MEAIVAIDIDDRGLKEIITVLQAGHPIKRGGLFGTGRIKAVGDVELRFHPIHDRLLSAGGLTLKYGFLSGKLNAIEGSDARVKISVRPYQPETKIVSE